MRTPLSARSVFMRPSNLMMTNLLQSLSFAKHLAKRSGNKLIRFRIPREPEQQRILNFASLTFENPEIANQLINQSSTFKFPLNSRAACNYETLFVDRDGENRDIGLLEVASLVGLPLNNRVGIRTQENAKTDHVTGAQRFVLAPISEKVEERAFEAEIKLERRQNYDENSQPGHQRANERNVTGSEFPDREMSALKTSLKRFGGFAGKISGNVTT